MRVEWSPRAEWEVRTAANRIAGDRPGAATRWLLSLREAVEGLGRFPESGRIVSEYAPGDVRVLLHRGYRVFYRVQADCVQIVSVQHQRRLLAPDELDDG